MGKIYFKKRKPEPKAMGAIDLSSFEAESKKNYARWFVTLVDDALKVSNIKSGKILDIGCGPGLLTKEFAGRSIRYEVVGLDQSKFALKLARKNCKASKNTRFILGKAEAIPFPDKSFDLVVCKDSLHELSNAKKTISEMIRVCKNGGYVYIQDLKRDLPWYLLKMVIPPNSTFKKLQYYSARASYTKNEIATILRSLDILHPTVKTKKITQKIWKKYSKYGISYRELKSGFQSRYIVSFSKK